MARLTLFAGTPPYIHCPSEISPQLRDHLLDRRIACSITRGAVSSGDQHIDSLDIDPDADLKEVTEAIASFTGRLPDWFRDLDES